MGCVEGQEGMIARPGHGVALGIIFLFYIFFATVLVRVFPLFCFVQVYDSLSSGLFVYIIRTNTFFLFFINHSWKILQVVLYNTRTYERTFAAPSERHS